jgi:hypothetical protein
MKKGIAIFMSVGVVVLLASMAFAAQPNGEWNAVYFNDQGWARGGSEQICFVADGTWYSTTFPAWGGHWFRKGDRVMMSGNWDGGLGNNGIVLQMISRSRMTGVNIQFRDGSSPSPWSLWNVGKLSGTCGPPASQGFIEEREAPGEETNLLDSQELIE